MVRKASLRRFGACALSLCVSSLLVGSAAAADRTEHTWRGGVGLWSNRAKWVGGVPNSANADVLIPGVPNAVNSATVTVDGSFAVGRLTLKGSSHVVVSDGSVLGLTAGAFGGAGAITGGEVTLNGDTADSTLSVNGNVLIASEVHADGGHGILSGGQASEVTIAGSMAGFANLGSDTVNFLNRGSVVLDENVNGQSGTLDPGQSYHQVFAGRLEAGSDATSSNSVSLARNHTFTLDGTVVIHTSATLTLDPTATLTNFNATDQSLHRGYYLVDGTLDLTRGPLLINAAHIKLAGTFVGLDSLTENQESLELAGPAFTTTGAFSNTGDLVVDSNTFTAVGLLTNTGRIKVLEDSTLQLTAGLTQTDGQLWLAGGTLNSPNAPVTVSAGRLQGHGTINGAVEDDGWLAIDNVTKIDGDLTLSAASTLEYPVPPKSAAPVAIQLLTVSGAVTLGGNLRVLVGDDPATVLNLLTAGSSLTGAFANVADGGRIETADGSGSYLVRYGAQAPDPLAVTLSDYQASAPLRIHGQVPGQPDGQTFVTFGPPEAGAFAGTFKTGKTVTRAIFAPDGHVRVKVSDAAPGDLSAVKITSLGNPNGDFALATLTHKAGLVTASSDSVLLGGLNAGPVRVAARTGDPIVNLSGATLASIQVFDGNGTVPFFLGKLRGSESGVALCAVLSDGIHVLVRQEQTYGATKIKTITTLVASGHALAQGRWRMGDASIGMKLTLQNGASGLYSIPASAAGPSDWVKWIGTGDVLDEAGGAVIRSLGLPSFTASGPAVAAAVGQHGYSITADNDAVLLRVDAGGPHIVAQKGGTIGSVTIGNFLDVVAGTQGRVAFTVAERGSVPYPAVFYSERGSFTPASIAARDVNGTLFTAIQSFAFPQGPGGPVIVGSYKPSGRGKPVTGITAIDSFGLPTYLIGGSTIGYGLGASLVAPATSLGAANGYDDHSVRVLVNAGDGSKALLRVAVP